MRGSTFRVSAAVVSALLIGGCGTVVAGSSNSAGEPPVLRVGLDGSQGMAAAKLSSGSGAGAYRVDGALPDGPSQASTYRVVPAAVTSVRRVAAALGLQATPRRHAHGWVVTSGGTELRMRDTGQWSVQRLADQCPPFLVDVDSADGSMGVACAVAVDVGAVPPEAGGATSDVRSTLVMSADHLRKVAYPLLSALGLDPTTAVVTVATSTVSVNPVVAGLPTIGYDSDVVIDNAGIHGATGWVYPGKPAAGDTYPLLKAKEALKLFGSGPRPMMGAPEIACPASTQSLAEMPIGCGEPLVVTGGRLGLELRWDGGPNGNPILLPAWFLAIRGSDFPLVLVAVNPKYLAEPVMPTTEPNPATSPSAIPGSTGSGSTGSGSSGGGSTGVGPAGPPGALLLSSYRVSADGRTLTLIGWGSPCERYGPAPARETDSAVTVGIVVTSTQPSGMACVDMAQQVTVRVKLATRLGTRTVIDRSNGAKVPPA